MWKLCWHALPRTPTPCLCKHTLKIMYIMQVFVLLCNDGIVHPYCTPPICAAVDHPPIPTLTPNMCLFTWRRAAKGEQVWSRARERAYDSATRHIYITAHHKGRTRRRWWWRSGTTTGTGDSHPPCGDTVSLPLTVACILYFILFFLNRCWFPPLW